MIQVAIGITVGLFISALVVYPYGKARSGLFNEQTNRNANSNLNHTKP
jgi:hypothetical protein